MKATARKPKRLTRQLLAFSAGIPLPPWLGFIRHCTTRCTLREMPHHHQAIARWLPAVLPAALALFLGRHAQPWVYMWLTALGLFAGAKWLTLFPIFLGQRRPSRKRLLAYCFLWPGLHPTSFLYGASSPPKRREWLEAAAKTLLGILLVHIARQLLTHQNDLLVGWIAMVGLVFVLHFGLFNLFSLTWRTFGIPARPLMRFPLAAKSVTAFWGARWNTAFTDLMLPFIRPMARHTNAAIATLVIFLISGLLHETVISIPTRAAYGLPTAYFLLQGAGQSIERSETGQSLGLSNGWRGRAFLALITVAPALALFPPAFIHKIILPMLRTL